MILQCPSCRSTRIAANHTGRKVCTSVGTVAGAASGIAAAASGARIGATVGMFAGHVARTTVWDQTSSVREQC